MVEQTLPKFPTSGSSCRWRYRLWVATTLADFETNNIAGGRWQNSAINPIMLSVLWLALGSLLRIFRNRQDLIFENFVLRQQLTVLKRRRPRPALNLFDKLFWVAVSRLWSQWKQSIIVSVPD